MRKKIEKIQRNMKTNNNTITEIQQKLINLEPRSRRNNILVILEKFNHTQLLSILKEIPDILLENRINAREITTERAHRSLCKTQDPENPQQIYDKN